LFTTRTPYPRKKKKKSKTKGGAVGSRRTAFQRTKTERSATEGRKYMQQKKGRIRGGRRTCALEYHGRKRGPPNRGRNRQGATLFTPRRKLKRKKESGTMASIPFEGSGEKVAPRKKIRNNNERRKGVLSGYGGKETRREQRNLVRNEMCQGTPPGGRGPFVAPVADE